MKKTALAIGAAASICLVGAGAPAALATTHHPAAKFSATVTPTKPKSGQAIVGKATGAAKKAQYYCLLTLDHKGITFGASLADTASLVTVNSNSAGKITCKSLFLPFKGTYKGKKHSCPPTKADKKAGWTCGLSFANANNHKQFTIADFKF
jgi:hypothetical protein